MNSVNNSLPRRFYAPVRRNPSHAYENVISFHQEEGSDPFIDRRPKTSSTAITPQAHARNFQQHEVAGIATQDGYGHQYLALTPLPTKASILGSQRGVQPISVCANLHGIFLPSEVKAGNGEHCSSQFTLTCYRRNLFQVDGSVVLPVGNLVATKDDTGSAPKTITRLEVHLSAVEIGESSRIAENPVPLVVIPRKSGSESHDPDTFTLIPLTEQGYREDANQLAYYPITWKRLQFRCATANNGRRIALQQQFAVLVTVWAKLVDNSAVIVAKSRSNSIIVRGRSPGHFKYRSLGSHDSTETSLPPSSVEDTLYSSSSDFPTHTRLQQGEQILQQPTGASLLGNYTVQCRRGGRCGCTTEINSYSPRSLQSLLVHPHNVANISASTYSSYDPSLTPYTPINYAVEPPETQFTALAEDIHQTEVTQSRPPEHSQLSGTTDYNLCYNYPTFNQQPWSYNNGAG